MSPDEKRVAVEVRDPDTASFDIWVLELATEILSPVTFDPGNDRDPVWSPDSQSVVFTSDRSGLGDLFHKTLGDPGTPVLLHTLGGRLVPEDWSSDYLIYDVDDGVSNEIHGLSLEDKKVTRILKTRFLKDEPHLSPDGKWLAFQSHESAGIPQIYIASFPDMNQRQVSRNGGAQPRWRGDGSELYFLSPSGDLMAVRPSESRPPEVLFATGIDVAWGLDQYSVSSDGQRFLIALPADPATAQYREINLVVNWFEELNELVPVR